MSNKFQNLRAALKGDDSPDKSSTEPREINDPSSEQPIVPSPPPPTKRKGRPQGKRSNPDYEQIGIYIPKALHTEVKKLLLEDKSRDFSDLVTELLKAWSKSK